jgi:hypothetical protein
MITYSLVFWSRAYELKTINFLDYIVGETYDNQYNRNTGQVDVQANADFSRLISKKPPP